MKRKILLSAVFIVLAISCVFAEQYTAQVILNLDVGAAKIKIYGTPLYETGNNTNPARIDYKIGFGGNPVGIDENVSFGNTKWDNPSFVEGYGYLLAEFSSSSKNDNGEGGAWKPWVFSVPIKIETDESAQDTVNSLVGGTSLTGTLTLCVESS